MNFFSKKIKIIIEVSSSKNIYFIIEGKTALSFKNLLLCQNLLIYPNIQIRDDKNKVISICISKNIYSHEIICTIVGEIKYKNK